MRYFLLMIAMVMGQSVLAADKKPVSKEQSAIVEKAIRKELKKPEGKLTKGDLEKVTGLYLDETKVTDAGLKEVAKLSMLDLLCLGDTKITDAGLKELTTLKQLDFLSLDDTQITDAGLIHVAKLQKLTQLFLYNTEITDAGLKELAKLPKLKRLLLYDNKVTKAGVARLGKALPKCKIYSNAKK